MGLVDNDQPKYVAYGVKVKGYWNDLKDRILAAQSRGMQLPFSINVFREDYIAAVAELTTILEVNLWISDDEYDSMRGLHAKANAYEDAFQKAMPPEIKKSIPGPAPDSGTIAPPPDNLGTTIEDASKAASNAVNAAADMGKIGLAIAVVIGGGYMLATRRKKGESKS